MTHPHDPATDAARRRLRQTFGMLMGREVTHLRIDYDDPRQTATVIGDARVMHGPRGVCTCCPRVRRLTVDGDQVGAP